MSYNPRIPPQDLKDLLTYLDDEFMRVAQALNSNISGEYQILYNAPARVFPGLVVYADGTSWNPGSGEGLYRRSLSNTWVKVG
jgi:hypothetical protein